MKKILKLILLLITGLALVACGKFSSKETVTVYSYSGGNQQFAIVNGVIILSEGKDIIYGGELREKNKKISDVVFESKELYVLSGDEKMTLALSKANESGGNGFSLSNPLSLTANLSEDEKGKLLEKLYFRLSIETVGGEKIDYDIKMKVVDVTGLLQN